MSAAIVFVLAPILGAITDQATRRLPFLVVSTVLCVSATFLLAQATQGLSFVLFVVAVVCFQAGLIAPSGDPCPCRPAHRASSPASRRAAGRSRSNASATSCEP